MSEAQRQGESAHNQNIATREQYELKLKELKTRQARICEKVLFVINKYHIPALLPKEYETEYEKWSNCVYTDYDGETKRGYKYIHDGIKKYSAFWGR
jgi:hypothetical protein